MSDPFDIFLVAPPGLEPVLAGEAAERGFAPARAVPGGVEITGGWPEVWRANLELRGATRVLVRLAEFRALHVAQLDKRARRVPWGATLRPDVPVRVEAACRASRIYHEGAVASRIARAIREELGAPVPEARTADAVVVKARIEDDLCTLSVDTSGEALHRRGYKQAVGKAPLRETLAALLLRAAGFAGDEPVLDPMCGSGTFVIEAAGTALGLAPGRARGFAFERLAGFDAAAWAALRDRPATGRTDLRFTGYDRDAGAVAAARANAERAGVAAITDIARQPVGSLERPDGPPGLVAVNPPYGTRIGTRKALHAVHDVLGRRLAERFSGWRVALVTADAGLARSTGLPFDPPGPPVPHGGLKLRLFRTGPLP
jgi:putative N6-adenine-specific DNA methylase